MRDLTGRVALVLVSVLAMLGTEVGAQSQPDGQLTIAFDASIAPAFLDPAETPGIATPFAFPGPSVMVLLGNGKNFEQFQADDAICRQWAAQQTGTTTKRAPAESTVSGAAIGAAAGSPAIGTAVPAVSRRSCP